MDEKEKDFLDGMTDDGSAEVVEAPEPATPEPEKVESPESPAAEAPTAPATRKEDTVPLAALRAEREKRQQYERELAELRQRAEQEKRPSFFEAPEEYLQTIVAQTQHQANQRLYAVLEEQAREAHPDYDEVFAEVEDHCRDNPAEANRILSSPNPALAAYKFGKQLRERRAMENPEQYRAQLEAEIRAKIAAETQAKEEARRQAAAAIPPDLATVRSTSSENDVAVDPFDKLF